MTTQNRTAEDLKGRTVRSMEGDKIGTVDDVHVDETGSGRFIETKTGWFGKKRHAFPLDILSFDGDDLLVPYTKQQIESAPTLDEDDRLDYDRERQMGQHYGYDVRDWDDTRDAWLDRDLTRGPTPETRGDFHDPGGTLDQSDGPTPETRRAMAATSPGTDPDVYREDLDADTVPPGTPAMMRVRYERISRRS